MAAAASVALYREGKLAVVRPAKLTGQIAWQGPDSAPCSLLFVGDSRVARWPIDAPTGWRVGRLGYPGQGSANIAAASRASIANADPTVVVIAAGINDAAAASLMPAGQARETIAATGAAIDGLAGWAFDRGARRVVLVTVVPPIEPGIARRLLFGDRVVRHAETLSRSIRRLGKGGRSEILDADRLFRDRGGHLREDLRDDAVHWNGRAYEHLNAVLWSMVADLPCGSQSPAREVSPG